MARLAIVGGAHDGDVLAAQAEARHDLGSEAGDRLKRLGAGAKIGQAIGVAVGRHNPALGAADFP